MRQFLLFLAGLLFLPALTNAQRDTSASTEDSPWEHLVEVKTGHVEFRDDIHFAYTAQIYNAEIKEAEKKWKKLMKNHAGKVRSRGDDIVAYDAVFPRLFANPVEVHTTFHELYTTKGVEMSVAFVREGRALMPRDMNAAQAEAEREVYDLAIEMNRDIVAEELDQEEKELQDMERDLERLRRDKEKLAENLAEARSKRTQAESDLTRLEEELELARQALADFESAMAAPLSRDQEKERKQLTRAVERAERDLARERESIEQYTETIREINDALPANEAELEKLTETIEVQMRRVEETRSKLRSVQ